MKVKILGCGPSFGVPSLSRGFGDCDPINPRNRRRRSSILIEDEGTFLLVDSGPEVREQLLNAGRPNIDAVLYTHAHYDHMGGADDLRAALHEDKRILPVYLSEYDEAHFKEQLRYVFQNQEKPAFDVHVIRPFEAFQVNKTTILPIPQKHGEGHSTGYRIGDFAYSTDVGEMEDASFAALAGVKVWILGVVTSATDTRKHLNVERALEWIDRVRPDRAYFTHMGTKMDYERLCQYLPSYIRPVYDGMEIEL